MTEPRHRPGARLRPEDYQNPHGAPSRPPDKEGHCAGLYYRAWQISRLTEYVLAVLWDEQGRTIPGRHWTKRLSVRPYHHVDTMKDVETLCRKEQRKRRVPGALQKHASPSLPRQETRSEPSASLVSYTDGDGEHTGFASEL